MPGRESPLQSETPQGTLDMLVLRVLVVGPAHEAILREASGSRPARFLIASDKHGNSAFSNAIIPAEVAAAAARTTPVVVYGEIPRA